MDTALAANPSGFLVGDRVTIADISSWGWVASHGKSPRTHCLSQKRARERNSTGTNMAKTAWAGVSLDEFPALDKWLHELLKRPGFEKGRHVPKPHTSFELAKLSEEELEAKAAGPRAWVQSGMKADAKK